MISTTLLVLLVQPQPQPRNAQARRGGRGRAHTCMPPAAVLVAGIARAPGIPARHRTHTSQLPPFGRAPPAQAQAQAQSTQTLPRAFVTIYLATVLASMQICMHIYIDILASLGVFG